MVHVALTIESGSSWPGNNWTLYEADGSRVESRVQPDQTVAITKYDRQGHSWTWTKEVDGSTATERLTDDGDYTITMQHLPACTNPDGGSDVPCDTIIQDGYGGGTLTWVAYYQQAGASWLPLQYINSRKGITTRGVMPSPTPLVTRVDLPQRTRPDGNSYTPVIRLTYGARYREISRLTLPSGTTVDYTWALDTGVPLLPAPKQHTEVALDPKLFDRYVGRYQLPDFILTITRGEDGLYAEPTNLPKIKIFPEGERDFFLKAVDAQITFEFGPDGRASALVLRRHGGIEERGKRIE